jgi:hypothetical protein
MGSNGVHGQAGGGVLEFALQQQDWRTELEVGHCWAESCQAGEGGVVVVVVGGVGVGVLRRNRKIFFFVLSVSCHGSTTTLDRPHHNFN